MNSKVAAANEKKAANEAVKAEKERQKKGAEEAKDWAKGSNTRGQSRAEAAVAKTDEALRKKREKEALLAAEEEEGTGGGGAKLKKGVGSGMKSKQSKNNRKKKGNDLSLLEDSLVSAADKKSRAAKKKEQAKREAALQQRQRQPAPTTSVDPLLANTATMLGNLSVRDDDDGTAPDVVGREANVLAGQTYGESGVDGALRTFRAGPASDDVHPEKRMKALHKAFEERMLPDIKQDYPGLKMSQYKEKIFTLWKKSKENPLNHQK